MSHLRATSEYIPDTTLHPLNGSHVVDIGDAVRSFRNGIAWLSPDEADAFADALKAAAALARQYRETDDEDDE